MKKIFIFLGIAVAVCIAVYCMVGSSGKASDTTNDGLVAEVVTADDEITWDSQRQSTTDSDLDYEAPVSNPRTSAPAPVSAPIPAPAPITSAANSSGNFVQVASFGEKSRADKLVEDLRPLGTTTIAKVGNYYRVYLEYTSNAEAQDGLKAVIAKGFTDAKVVRLMPESGTITVMAYNVRIGSYENKKWADNLASELVAKGLGTPEIRETTVNGKTYWRVQYSYADKATAQEKCNKVTDSGFPDARVFSG